MSEVEGLQTGRPVSLWNRAVNVNFKDLFKSMSKAAVDIVSGNYVKVIPHGLDALFSIKLEDKKPAELGWLLIFAGLTRSLHTLADKHVDLLRTQPDDLEKFCGRLDSMLENAEVEIRPDFFQKPGEIPFLDNVKDVFKEFLSGFGLSEAEAQGIADRLPAYFVFALEEEWRERPTVYGPLLKALGTPITGAAERLRKWRRYSAWLQMQAEERVFLEAFSLSKVYIPPRAYWEEKKPGDRKNPSREATERTIKHVVDLTEELQTWLDRADKDDALRVICGDPGCGKSSFAKMFAGQIARRGTVPVLLVPLHRYSVERDLRAGVRNFMAYDQDLPQDPLDHEKGDSRLFVIFDGLDELAQQGKAGKELVEDFLYMLNQEIPRFNSRITRLQILVTGRELVVRSNIRNFRGLGQVLHFLPYYEEGCEVEEDDDDDSDELDKEVKEPAYDDPQGLLKKDQRQEWWRMYWTVKGKPIKGLPEELDTGQLTEITAQPLLNYLLAISYDRKRIDFSSETNLNRIYDDLIDAIYERVWEGFPKPIEGQFVKDSAWPPGRQHPALASGMDKNEFKRILQEIAVSAWHGESRSTTVSEVKKRCDLTCLDKCLSVLEANHDSGILRLFTAFYFRQSEGRRSDDPTFEFTHKSFGEYLAASRIIRLVAQIQKRINQRSYDPEGGWSDKEALVKWAELCGPAAVDMYLLEFLRNEAALHSNDVAQWQHTIAHLLGYLLRHGNPIEELRLPNYRTETVYARNAEEALLAVLNACARVTKTLSTISWLSPTCFGTWISALRGQRSLTEPATVLDCLSFLDLRDQAFKFQDLREADMYGCDFSDAKLASSHLDAARLSDTILEMADLSYASLSFAELFDANLSGANLFRARLAVARLFGADLSNANLIFADLDSATLIDSNLSGANLEKADLSHAQLQGANLQGANLRGANLRRANLVDANLEDAKLEGTYFELADLRGTILDPAYGGR